VQEQFEFAAEHPLIRSLTDYGQLVHAAFEQTQVVSSSPTHKEIS
jgi:hypothetical protein